MHSATFSLGILHLEKTCKARLCVTVSRCRPLSCPLSIGESDAQVFGNQIRSGDIIFTDFLMYLKRYNRPLLPHQAFTQGEYW